MESLMKSNAKIKTIKQNLDDGLLKSYGPLKEGSLLADLKYQLSLHQEILDGIKRRAENETLSNEDMDIAIKVWNNIRTNLNRALSLLEYIDKAIESDEVDLDKCENIHFPLEDEVKQGIEGSRKVRAKLDRLVDIDSWESRSFSNTQ